MFYRYSLMLVRSAAVTATLFALMVILMVPTRAPAMELKIVGNQLFLSGPVVGDEPRDLAAPAEIRRGANANRGMDTAAEGVPCTPRHCGGSTLEAIVAKRAFRYGPDSHA